jgi:hypothetical protein
MTKPSIAPLASGTGTLVGYARVSTVDQNPELHRDDLSTVHIRGIFDRPIRSGCKPHVRRNLGNAMRPTRGPIDHL